MIKFQLPAKVFMAAQLFQAKNDVRYYLNGVFVSPSAIVATNGHCMFYHERENEVHKPLILKAIERIPAKAYRMNFEINESGKGVAFILDSDEALIGSTIIEVIDGKFPDWERIAKAERGRPEPLVGINASYLSVLEKAVKLVGNKLYCGVEMSVGSANESLHFKIPSPELDPSNVVIMPMRL